MGVTDDEIGQLEITELDTITSSSNEATVGKSPIEYGFDHMCDVYSILDSIMMLSAESAKVNSGSPSMDIII